VRRLIAIFAIVFIAGCAYPKRSTALFDTKIGPWQGRMALRVLQTPVLAFSANFELEGTPKAGRLVFTSPLGTTLAKLQWNPEGAMLQANGKTENFDNLDALTQQAVGSTLPITALFAWLVGDEANQLGWSADLHALDTGRLTARRAAPHVPAELKIILD
jgi:outer membrane lipoprotein LolB